MGKYKIIIRTSAQKEINRLDSKKDRIAVMKKMVSLETNPYPVGSKKLKGRELKRENDIYRVRQGNYRLLYEVNEQVMEVYIVKVGYRKNVYK